VSVIKLIPTLQRREHPLSSTDAQRRALSALPLRRFAEAAASAGHAPLQATSVSTLQINVGKRCNQTCRHCHVDAGPDRKEVMPPDVVAACLRLLEQSDIPTLDITGGAPELHPQFREIVVAARALGRHVMDRCNLTITRLPNYAYLPDFLAEQRVEVVASLPHFAGSRTDAQRGDGVFEQSIAALRDFNARGYGHEGTGLLLNLVTNPSGAFLPAGQASLEREWKRELQRRYGIVFNSLYTITNMPISRYLDYLVESDNFEAYMEKLVNAFNPASVAGLMCRTTLSVGWDGRLYDCDFNQMLEMALPQSILDADLAALASRVIRVGQHCFGCTAGAGSSCGGAVVTS
jgi:radical SAM/Cys-rich protein